MLTWTEAAEAALNEHVASLAPELLARGLSSEAVAKRLRLRVDEELAAYGISVAGRIEVEDVLGRCAQRLLEEEVGRVKRATTRLGITGLIFGGLFGVLIPLTALVMEILTGMSAEIFDPIPTFWHGLAIAGVVVANGWLLRLVSREENPDPDRARQAMQWHAVAMGVALWYALWYAPISPIAVVGIIVFGLGLLPLAPLFSLIVGFVLRRKLRRRTETTLWPAWWKGLAAGLLLLLALEAPDLFTRWAAGRVANGAPETQARVLPWLRRLGSEEALWQQGQWRSAHDEFRRTANRTLFGDLDRGAAQAVFFRMTGRSPLQEKISRRSFLKPGRWSRDWQWDFDQGGEKVGMTLKDLRLQESRLDGTLDGDGAAGYVEWTMVFRNDSEFQQREARALLQLPPGAVVSRLTLWINGEEREAAFGGQSEVRQAYEAVVRRQRDPVLVSWLGADRVLVQCFPVEPKGGEMKIRVGISMPLILDAWDEARVALPRIIEQNFTESENLRHVVWLEARAPVTAAVPGARAETASSGRPAVAFTLSPQHQVGTVSVKRTGSVRTAVAHARGEAGIKVRQDLVETGPQGGLCFVLDGSAGMEPAARALAAVFRRLPEKTRVRLLVAGDAVRECPYQVAAVAADWVERQEFVGGQDATEALLCASENPGEDHEAVIWIHGAQPVRWGSSMELEQKLARAGARLRFLTVGIGTSGNVLFDLLAKAATVQPQPRLGLLEDDIARVVRHQREGTIAIRRSLVTDADMNPAWPKVTDHVVRLWALEEVNRLRLGQAAARQEALRLAVAQQLVTPVSSAVVLETKAQYDAAGLAAVDPETVPSVPDGGMTAVLLALGLVGLAVMRRFRARPPAPSFSPVP